MKTYHILISILFILVFVSVAVSTEITGRVSLRWYRIDNRLNGDTDAPAIRFRMNFKDLFARNLNFYVYYRGERDLEGNRITKSRMYDLRLRADRLPGGIGLEVGRINSPVVGAYGIIDGVSLRRKLGYGLTTGAFWGAEPDLLTFRMNDEIKRAGMFLELDRGYFYQGAFSVIRQTYLNKMDRLYLYLDNDINLSKVLSFSQFAEIDLRQKENETVENTFHFTNVFADLRFSPSRIFNMTLTFNSRKEFKYLESMSYLPDSLFESAVSHSYGIRANLRPLKNWRVYGSFRLGERYDQVGYEKLTYVGLVNNHFFSNNMFINLRHAKNDGFYATSESWYFSMERRLSNRLRILSAFYQSNFENKDNGLSNSNHSVDLVFVYNLSWRLYLYLKATRSWGTDLDENRFFVEFSYNIRKYHKKRREK